MKLVSPVHAGLRSLSCVFVILACIAADKAFADDIVLAPSAASDCLTRAHGAEEKLVYPKAAFENKDGGVVKAKMVFHAADKGPRISIERNELNSDLDDAVKEYLEGYRLPCFNEKDGPVSLRQDYVFTPNDGRKVMSTSPEDEADDARKPQLTCIKSIDDWDKPYFPEAESREGAEGNFYVELSFSGADTPPDLKWIAAANNKAFRRAIEFYAGKLRMPCHEGGPVRARMLFKFMQPDGEKLMFRNMGLRDFLIAGSKIPRPVFFDLNKMACPFDLRVTYMQPYAPNVVSELETTNASRKPLIDWISNIGLPFSETQANRVLGDSFNLSIPCGSVSL